MVYVVQSVWGTKDGDSILEGHSIHGVCETQGIAKQLIKQIVRVTTEGREEQFDICEVDTVEHDEEVHYTSLKNLVDRDEVRFYIEELEILNEIDVM